MLDQPSDQTKGGVQAFLQANNHIKEGNQLHVLPLRDIEQCYPDQACPIYINWRKSQEELDAVNENGAKIITGRKKRQLAKHVGNNITKEQFEADLNKCFEALIRCWDLSF